MNTGKQQGRDTAGRFAKGNRFGKGRKIGKRIARFRSVLVRSVSMKDVADIVETLKRQALNGDLAAVKIIFDRLFGPPVRADVLEELEKQLYPPPLGSWSEDQPDDDEFEEYANTDITAEDADNHED